MESLGHVFRRTVLRSVAGMLLSPLTRLRDSSTVGCEVCGQPVRVKADEGAAIIEFRNFIPEYTETYGFCSRHRPYDLQAVKRRIHQGKPPVEKEV